MPALSQAQYTAKFARIADRVTYGREDFDRAFEDSGLSRWYYEPAKQYARMYVADFIREWPLAKTGLVD